MFLQLELRQKQIDVLVWQHRMQMFCTLTMANISENLERKCRRRIGGDIYTSLALSLIAGIYGISLKADKSSNRFISTFHTIKVMLKLN